MNIKKFFIIFIILILTPRLTFSAPSISNISGILTHGSQIMISGSGFGTHADHNTSENYLNTRWKDFEDNSITSGGWDIMGDLVNNSSLQIGGKNNSTRYFRRAYFDDERGALEFPQSGTTGDWYVSFWFMMPPNNQGGKFFRIYGSGSAQNIYLATGCDGRSVRGFSECTSCSPSPETVWGSPDSFLDNVWHRVEILMDQNPSTFTVFLDGQEQFNRSNWVYDSFGGNGHTIDIGNMVDEPGAFRCPTHPTWNESFNYDDIFVDYTFSRVELCSGNTWNSRGTCEIQIPSAWSDNSVTIAANQGSFANGSQAYLYVVDSTGEVNANGFPVTIGEGGGDTTSPQSPTSLQVK